MAPVIEAIDKLPKLKDVTLKDKKQIEKARALYNKLAKADKANVSNISKLEELEDAVTELDIESKKIEKYSFTIPKKMKEDFYIYMIYGDETPKFSLISPLGERISLGDDIEKGVPSHKDIDMEVQTWELPKDYLDALKKEIEEKENPSIKAKDKDSDKENKKETTTQEETTTKQKEEGSEETTTNPQISL